MHIRGVLVVITVLTFCAPAKAQSLWQNSSYGMTVEQVLQTVAHAVPIQGGSHLGDGAEELVNVPNLTISSQPFVARFYFLNRKLTQVTLNLTSPLTYSQTHPMFLDLLDLLRAKYGKEITLREQTGTMLNESVAEWLAGKTNIDLLLMGVGDSTAILNINYQVRLSTEGNSL